MNITYFTNTVILIAPIMFWIVGLVPATVANNNPKLISRVHSTVAWCAFASALLAAAAFPFDRPHSLQLISQDLPGNIGAFSISTYINTVTLIMLVLVSFVGAIVTRYARNYLDGDPQQGRFHKWLSLTLASILTLIISGNLLMFALAWISTSLCLHQLLMFYKTRPAAVLVAHKKFIASRIGDVSLIIATILIGSSLHTLEFEKVFQIMSTFDGPLPLALQWASWLIILSAALKSAQFPFHGWLIQVMEAPTPVSALLHAGIVNAGAFLVIRMSPIVSQSPSALGMLAIIGLVTLALASLVMLTQTSIKVSLAWSTTAQMGFMLLECGLGLYSLAMLHLVAHSLYKAHAFLSSGSGVDSFRAPAIDYGAVKPQAWRLVFAFAFAVLLTLGIAMGLGIGDTQQPALMATTAVIAIAMTQLLLQASSLYSNGAFILRAMALAVLVSTSYFVLHHLFEVALAGSVLPASPNDTFQLTLVVVIIAVFIGLLLLQQVLKTSRSRLGETIYVHLYNGLYIDVYITRMLQRVWPAPLAKANSNGGKL
ncbi:MAG: NADH-quinone oxidoreductase subunit L [Acidiferrobacterales bacterium]|jgi:NAD(P)H-quinone oxidoreductase subunit 5|nr:NADH-quinone oxidoreductase subunit L [Acidiferrobacterales bacterium]